MTTSISPAEPAPEGSATRQHESPTVWTQTAHSPEFDVLRRRLRSFVFPVAALFLSWYLAYALLLVYAREFMSEPVIGNVTVAILLALLQFGTTFAITIGYVSYANRKLDPVADDIRDRIEGGQQ